MAPPEDWTMLYVAALFSAMAIGWVWRYAREAFDVRFCVVAVTCVFAIVHAHFQIKGWYYHYYPFFAFFPLLIAMAIAAARPHQLHNKWYYAASILLLIGLSFNVATKAPRPFKPSNSSAYKMEFTANLHKEIIDAAQYMPPDIKESFLTSPQKPILWLTFFCDRCNLWYGAYHFGWEAVGRYTFLTPLLHRHKPYSIKARADFVQKFLATPPPIIIYSGNGGAFWSITREHEALASLMARSYKSYVSSDLYTIMVRVQ